MGKTAIEWTRGEDGSAGATWNPVAGCSVLSPGCINCYAMRMAARLQKMNRTGGSNSNYVNHYDGTTQQTKAGPVWTGKVVMAPENILHAPLSWKKPRRVFVNSMSDLFHESIPDEWIVAVLDIIRRTSYDGGSNLGTITGCGEHTYLVLTKRAARMAAFMPRLRFNHNSGLNEVGLYLADDGRPSVVMKNLWLGTSAERQQEADERIPLLLQTPAAVRFISAEPLLGPLDLTRIKVERAYGTFLLDVTTGAGRDHHGHSFSSCLEGRKLDWVITGGESGPGARPMGPGWAGNLRDQCAAAGVPYFHKQNGEYLVLNSDRERKKEHIFLTKDWDYVRVGKKAAGRMLDGREHNEMPTARF